MFSGEMFESRNELEFRRSNAAISKGTEHIRFVPYLKHFFVVTQYDCGNRIRLLSRFQPIPMTQSAMNRKSSAKPYIYQEKPFNRKIISKHEKCCKKRIDQTKCPECGACGYNSSWTKKKEIQIDQEPHHVISQTDKGNVR